MIKKWCRRNRLGGTTFQKEGKKNWTNGGHSARTAKFGGAERYSNKCRSRTIYSEVHIKHFVDFETLVRQSNHQPKHNAEPQPQSTGMNQNDPNLANFHFEEESLRLGGEDITAYAPQQLRQRIWAHQYINIALLLKNNVVFQDLCFGGLVHITEKDQIETRPKTVKDKVPNIEKMDRCFSYFHLYLS